MIFSRINAFAFLLTSSSSPFFHKAAWAGVLVVNLTKAETRGTTISCPRCGERLQSAVKGDGGHYRQLWCDICRRWVDRDVAAVVNISRRGWMRFAHSKGQAGEAVRGNPVAPVILGVEASKLPLQLERPRNQLSVLTCPPV